VEDVKGTVPAGAVVLIDGTDPGALAVGGGAGLMERSFVEAPKEAGGKAVRVKVLRVGKDPWEAQIHTPRSVGPVRKGDGLFVAYGGGGVGRAEGAGRGVVGAYVQRATAPWAGFVSDNQAVGAGWRHVRTFDVAKQDAAAGEVNVAVHLAQQVQTLEFGSVVVLNLGQNVDASKVPYTEQTYPGREADAPWRRAAEERIERHRKGELRVEVVDGAGKPVEGAAVAVRMKRHAYGFGSFAEIDALLKEGREGDQYRAWTKRLFNRATTPIYWADWGWANPKTREKYHRTARWLQENGFPTRGHVMIYPGWQFMPAEARRLGAADPAAFRKRLLAQIAEVAEATRQYGFDGYDVTNELRQLREVTDIVGNEGVVEWFVEARKHTGAKLALNENTIVENGGITQREQEHFERMLRMLIDAKAPLDVIGIQGHFGEALTPPDRVVAILDRFAKFGLPIHITEFDIETRDERAQGDYMRDFLTAAFSHPATEGFTQWGFWEGQHWKPVAAMLRKDFSLKPSGQAYVDLVLKRWWTEADGPSDAAGRYTTRGFLGEYEVTVRRGETVVKSAVRLGKEGAVVRVKVE